MTWPVKITQFYNTDYVDASSYDNLRKIASVADGLKNSGRKVIHTVLAKNITKDTKVSRLKSTVSEFTEYLHGEDNLAGVIVNIARRYTGTNNLPLLKEEGNFGKRHKNDASADRYIFTAAERYLPKLFNKDDTPTLVHQTFEGAVIEPRYFTPVLPTLLINGSPYAISSGFTQFILARPLGETLKATKKYIETGEFVCPNPGWNGFQGSVVDKGDRKFWVYGKFERVNTTNIRITELPIGYELKSYIKVLDTLEDNKVIESYQDRSTGSTFTFNIKVTRKFSELNDEKIYEALKLIAKFTEFYNVMGPDNRILEFKTPEEVFYEYARIREEQYVKRKEYLIEKIKEDLKMYASKYLFVKNVVDGNIVVNNQKKDAIIKQIEPVKGIIEQDGSYDYLLRMPIYSLTEEKLKELHEKIVAEKQRLTEVEAMTVKDMWLADITSLTTKD